MENTPTDSGLIGWQDLQTPSNKPLFSSLGTGVYPRSVTITAIAVHADHTNSAEASTTFTVQTPAAQPTFRPETRDVTNADILTIRSTTEDATIHYTTDGTIPTATSPLSGTTPLAVNFSTIGTGEKTITAIAVHADHANSAPAEATFNVVQAVAAARPSFSPTSGRVATTGRLTISSSPDGATIRYTTDGSTPTDSGLGGKTYDPRNKPLFSSLGTGNYPRSVTITAIAVYADRTNSAEASTTFTVQTPAAQPTFSPASGDVATTDTLTIDSDTDGAIIHYTINGGTPTAESPLFGTTPLVVNFNIGTGEKTIRAIAVHADHANSDPRVATFMVQTPAETPTFSSEGGAGSGIVPNTGRLTINTRTSGATIRYTTNGRTPTDSGMGGETYNPRNKPLFSSLGTGNYPRSLTIKAIAVHADHANSAEASTTFTVQTRAAQPTFAHESGNVETIDRLTFNTHTDDATIRYTTNENTPTDSGMGGETYNPRNKPLFSSLREGSGLVTITAIAVKENYISSAVAGKAFSVSLPRTATPTFSPEGGTGDGTIPVVSSTSELTITSTTGSTIYYTTSSDALNIQTPTKGSSPLTVSFGHSSIGSIGETHTIRAFAEKDGYTNSAEASTKFTVKTPVATPTFSPEGGVGSPIVPSTDSLTIESDTENATIYYTTDKSSPTTDPTNPSPSGRSPLTVSFGSSGIGGAGDYTITAIAVHDDHANSAEASTTFVVRTPVVTPTFSPGSGIVPNTGSLTITSAPGSTIHYTTDRSTPSISTPTKGPSPLTVSFGNSGIGGLGNYTIKAIAVKTGNANSAEASTTFTVERDVDLDNNGLIDINNLDMLNNIRHNPAGTSYDDEAPDTGEGDTGSTAGAPATRPAICTGRTTTTLCGYELTQDLDFATAAHYAGGTVNRDWRPNTGVASTATNTGFPSLESPPIFEGNGHTINNLYSRSGALFGEVSSGNIVRNVGVTNIYVQTVGAGGLAGSNAGRIIASYASGTVNGGGGLVGYNSGTIMASYANVEVSGEYAISLFTLDSATGGLVGVNLGGTIIASYATGTVVNDVDPSSYRSAAISMVGGLVGLNWGAQSPPVMPLVTLASVFRLLSAMLAVW